VILILTADAADLLLPTIVSRCQPLPLRPLPVEVVRAALMTRGAPPDTAQTLAQISGGRIGWAIRALADPAELAQRAEWLDLLEIALQGTRRERFALVEKLSLEKTGLQTMLDFWVGYWRDALLIASGSRAPITNYDRQAALQALAERAGMGAVQHALDATRRTSQHLNKNVNTRLALEVLMLDYPLP
jgi:DNA polymerase-3 subunit delta'